MIDYSTPIVEAPRATWRRRLQQRRCVACGARNLVNNTTSYFCAAHVATHRYCTLCETLRTTEEHGRDSRCKACASARSLAHYYADPDRTLYRIRLRQMAQRTATRGDQIFTSVRRRVALADLVRRTPGMSWPRRAALVNSDPTWLADAWRKQARGDVRDPDQADRAKERRSK